MKAKRKFIVVMERDKDGYYVATVPSLQGSQTQAKTLDTLVKSSSSAWKKRTRKSRDLNS
jgi:predicted RNase H-like HicB family nuclease